MKKLILILMTLSVFGIASTRAGTVYHNNYHGTYYHGGRGYYGHGSQRYYGGGYYHGRYYNPGYYPGNYPFFGGVPVPFVPFVPFIPLPGF